MQQAGSHNVAHTTATIIAYLGMDKYREQALRDAVAPLFNGDASETTVLWHELEKVPYLQACIQEGLRYGFILEAKTRISWILTVNHWNRIAIGSMLRAPRISPDDGLYFRGWNIPKGVSKTPSIDGNEARSLTNFHHRRQCQCQAIGCTWTQRFSQTRTILNLNAGYARTP